MACGLNLKIGSSSVEVGFYPAKLRLEQFRISHRSRCPKLLPAGIGHSYDFVDSAGSDTYQSGRDHYQKNKQGLLVERARFIKIRIKRIEEITRWHDKIRNNNIVTA